MSTSWSACARAARHGRAPRTPASPSRPSARRSPTRVVSVLLPDQVQPAVYEQDVAPNLASGAAVLFAHGFNVHFGRVHVPPAVT